METRLRCAFLDLSRVLALRLQSFAVHLINHTHSYRTIPAAMKFGKNQAASQDIFPSSKYNFVYSRRACNINV
ncbi:hypothetical protein Y032_0035g3091 [Ancylostoma ceylanicum]|uniref:Uncharacterized protein n=1 Tax=Ancylostoma ceylanicum TaxID=53326 RepID=A0A016UMC3_9BILA|nr:hypothetical protein Y032_0035g3091 [Ancylostoma ceylanicum]